MVLAYSTNILFFFKLWLAHTHSLFLICIWVGFPRVVYGPWPGVWGRFLYLLTVEVVSLLVDYHRFAVWCGALGLFSAATLEESSDACKIRWIHLRCTNQFMFSCWTRSMCSMISSYCALTEIRPVYGPLSSCSWFRPWLRTYAKRDSITAVLLWSEVVSLKTEAVVCRTSVKRLS